MRSTMVRLGLAAAVLLLVLRSVPSAGQQVVYAALQRTPTLVEVKPPAPLPSTPAASAKTPIVAVTQAPILSRSAKPVPQVALATIAPPNEKPTGRPEEPTDTPAIPEQKPTTVIPTEHP